MLREYCVFKTSCPGSSTAVIGTFVKETGKLTIAHLGDSGFLIVRDGKLLFASKEQEHFQNAPYQACGGTL